MAFKTLGWDVPTFPMHNANTRRQSICSNATRLPAPVDTAKIYAINIANVPVDLTSSRVRDVCSQYGKLLHVVRITDTDWAVVHFGSLSEATNAIKGLNANKTLGWHVKLAKSDRSDKSNDGEKSDNQHKTESQQKDMNWLRNRLKSSPSGSIAQSARTSASPSELMCKTLETGQCVLCKSPTKYTCSQCMAFYCSKKCQRQDWKIHQTFCFAIPDLVPIVIVSEATSNSKTRSLPAKPPIAKVPKVNLQKRLANLTISAKTIESTHKAQPVHRERPKNNAPYMITHIHNHHTVSIRSMERNDDTLYLKLLNDCADYEQTAKPFTEMPVKGQMVLAEFMGSHYRAHVLKVKSEIHIEVMFVDFGNKEKKTLSELKVLRADLGQSEVRTYRVRMAGVDTKRNNDRVMNYLNDLLDECKTLKLVYKNKNDIESSPVTLIDIESLEVINDKVAKLNGQT